MDFAQTIVNRRSIRKYQSTAVPKARLHDLLYQSASLVQTDIAHTTAWRCLYYDQTDAKIRLADSIVAKIRESTFGKLIPSGIYQFASKQVIQTPSILIFIAKAAPDQRLSDLYYAQVCRVIQNLQLLGWENNLGMLWYTEPTMNHPYFAQEIGLREGEAYVGMINVGYFEKLPNARKRTSAIKKWTNLQTDAITATSPIDVTPERILALLDQAVWAPNDGLREPWRFVYAPTSQKARLMIVVTAENDAHKRKEDFAAASCLIQNFILLAETHNWHVQHTIPQWCYEEDALLKYGIRSTEQLAGVLEWSEGTASISPSIPQPFVDIIER